RHSKTVISRANLLALYCFRAFGREPSRALGREKKRRRCDEQSGVVSGHSAVSLRARWGAKKEKKGW
ncbi:MAG TPA: hypothetical protein VGM44_21660, partial [Polyangiaceae bacterium]